MPRTKKQHLKRRPDGRYLCRYQGICFYGYTEDEALNAREDYKKQQRYGRPEIFSGYAARWLSIYKSDITKRGYNNYARDLNRFMEIAGDKPLDRYTQTDVVEYLHKIPAKSTSALTKAKAAVTGVFSAAYADGLITRDPTYRIKLPKGTKGTHRAITPEERQLIHQLQHRFRPAIMTMLYAGLRRGEVCALDVQRDIDFKKKTITVRQSIRFEDNDRITCTPKTEAGLRTIPLLDILANELKDINGLVCVSDKGKPMTEKAFTVALRSYNAALNKMRRTPGIDIRAHDLRHSYCTMLYDAGVDIKSAMLWMGHADQKTTMQIYTHLSDTRRTEAEKALREAEKNLISRQNASQTLLETPGTIEN